MTEQQTEQFVDIHGNRDLQQGKRGAMTWGHRPPWRPLWPNRRQETMRIVDSVVAWYKDKGGQ